MLLRFLQILQSVPTTWMKRQLLKRVNTLNNCLPIKRAIWILLLHWLLLQKLLRSWKRSAKSKTALNKRRFEIKETTRKGGFFMVYTINNKKELELKKFSELNLYRKMLSMFLLTFSYTLLITIVFIFPISNDKGTTLASCLSVSATLYAAIVAYLLLDNWKIEHRENLKSAYFQKTFDKYIELKDAIYVLQNIHDSWLEDIYRNQGQI